MRIARDFSEPDCLCQFKEDDKRAFDALFRHSALGCPGLSYPKLAERQGVLAKTLEARIRQALKTLRSYFRRPGGGLLVLALGNR